MESWEARTSIQNRAAVDPLIISLKEITEEEFRCLADCTGINGASINE
jgi:hypothetical protein